MLNSTPDLFFFSSRRRHTRLQGDWSSDVCSSDLGGAELASRTPDSTCQPSDASARATSRPMPRLAPVISAVRAVLPDVNDTGVEGRVHDFEADGFVRQLPEIHGAESQTTDLKSRAAARFVLH